MGAAEVVTWQAVTSPLDGADGFFDSAASRHPLVLLGLRWLLAAGVLPFQGEGWLRLPFVFVGTISIPLAAVAAATLVPRGTALAAAVLLALHPWHVAQSQTCAPPVVALAFALLAVLAAVAAGRRAGWRRGAVAAVAAALACASDRCGWLLLPMLAAGWVLAQWRPGGRWRRVWLAGAGLCLVALPAVLHQVVAWPFAARAATAPAWEFVELARPAILLLALLAAWVCRPVPVAVLGAAVVPLAGAGVAAAAGATIAADDLLLLLLPWSLLAAAVATTTAARVRAAVAGRTAWVGAAAAPAALATTLFVDVLLHETEYQGHRPPWREAAQLALHASTSARELVVGAWSGHLSLLYYLRPNHWRDPARDLHPGRRVERLDEPLAPAFEALLAGAAGSQLLLVLRGIELQAFADDAALADRLHREFELQQVLPCPQESGDGTLYVFRRRSAD